MVGLRQWCHRKYLHVQLPLEKDICNLWRCTAFCLAIRPEYAGAPHSKQTVGVEGTTFGETPIHLLHEAELRKALVVRQHYSRVNRHGRTALSHHIAQLLGPLVP